MLILATELAAYNRASPDRHLVFESGIEDVLRTEYGFGPAEVANVTNLSIPNVLRVNPALPIASPNGLGLGDDVTDSQLGLWDFNSHGRAGNAVNANDVEFRTEIPYCGAPHGVRIRPGTTCNDGDNDLYYNPNDPSPGCTWPFGSNELPDCDDDNPLINPDAVEICDDGVDNNCDGAIDGADSDCSAGMSGRAVRLEFVTFAIPIDDLLCLHVISRGCIAEPDACLGPRKHLHFPITFIPTGETAQIRIRASAATE